MGLERLLGEFDAGAWAVVIESNACRVVILRHYVVSSNKSSVDQEGTARPQPLTVRLQDDGGYT